MSQEGYRSPSAAPARANLPGMAPGSNPCLFVVGAAGSGTTLLQRMLDAHPLLAVVSETYWLPRKYRGRTGLTRDGLVTSALLAHVDEVRSVFTANLRADDRALPRSW